MKRETLEAFQMRSEKADEMGPGSMTEYGWWDKAVEDEIDLRIERDGIDRIEAIILIFNNI